MRILINTVPLYGKGEGLRTYTAQLLNALHETDADMEWSVGLRPADLERLGLGADPRFRLPRFAAATRPPSIPGVRFAVRNAIDQMVAPLHGRRFDALHFLDSYGPLWLSDPTPLVLTVHDLFPLTSGQYFTPWTRRYLATLMRRSIPRAAGIMADSDATSHALQTVLRIPTERIHVTPIGADSCFKPAPQAERMRVAKRYAITAPYLLSIGTIEPRKNLARVIRAFARAKREAQAPHHLLIVGKLGWGYEDVLAALAEANLGEAIRLLGYLPSEDLPPLISGADALAQLSLEEGFGLPVAEGMACGAPIITSESSALAEVAGNAGYLVTPTSERAIAEAFIRLCVDEPLRLRLRTASLQRARLYTWERVAQVTIALYQSVRVPASH